MLLTALACIAPEELMNVVSAKDTMADYSRIRLNWLSAKFWMLPAFCQELCDELLFVIHEALA